MSLSVDGVWKSGVWATTVWANGVWREGVITETITYSGGWGQTYRKRKRHKIETEEEKEAVEIVERVVERAVKAEPDTKQDDIELAIRMALMSNEIVFRAIYLKIALNELESIRHEMAMEEEAAVVLMMLH